MTKKKVVFLVQKNSGVYKVRSDITREGSRKSIKKGSYIRMSPDGTAFILNCDNEISLSEEFKLILLDNLSELEKVEFKLGDIVFHPEFKEPGVVKQSEEFWILVEFGTIDSQNYSRKWWTVDCLQKTKEEMV